MPDHSNTDPIRPPNKPLPEVHKHFFQPAGVLQQNRVHAVTNAPMMRPSLILLCGCGEIDHRWIPEPKELESQQSAATQAALRQGRPVS